MTHKFERIKYTRLNARQRENFNFQKVSAVLADYGFATIRLTSDWHGADFIAQHADGNTFLKVQLKARLTFEKKYVGRDLYICCPAADGDWYVYRHDEVLQEIGDEILKSRSWAAGRYSYHTLSKKMKQSLEPYRLASKGTRAISMNA